MRMKARSLMSLPYLLSIVGLLFASIAAAEETAGPGVRTLEESGLACGESLQIDEVLVVDVEGQQVSDGELRRIIESESGPFTLAANEALLVAKFFTDGKTRRQFMVRHAQQEVAAAGCNLAVVLGIEFVEKQWADPSAIRVGTKRWVTMGYALVLVGAH